MSELIAAVLDCTQRREGKPVTAQATRSAQLLASPPNRREGLSATPPRHPISNFNEHGRVRLGRGSAGPVPTNTESSTNLRVEAAPRGP